MKKIFILVCGFLFICQHNFSQNISFPDDGFKVRLIMEGVDKNSDGEISVDEALQVNNLNISGGWALPDISDITGIEYFKNLDTLNCSDNSISKIDSLPFLEYLNCNGNNFKILDVTKFTRLKFLYCNPSDTLILDNPLLEVLNVQSNIFIDVSKSPLLKKLICIPSSSPSLINNRELEFLQFYALAGQITNVDLTNNTKLKHLDIWCNLTSIDLSHNPELTYLVLGQNDISTLDLSANSKLDSLNCATNQLTSLDLSNCVHLLVVSCEQNKLTNLNLNGLSRMKILACNNNQLTDINLNDNIALEDLYISRNLLDSLDLSKNVSLKHLFCDEDSLVSLDLSNNSNLINVQCSQNKLTSLNVDGLTKLVDINVPINNLKKLNLSTNQALEYVGLYHNLIDSLDLSHNTNLQIASLTYMPTLKRVCVSELPVPFLAYTQGSPNLYFDVCSFTSIQNFSTDKYSIYPIPANDKVIVENPLNGTTELTIYDLSGKILYKKSLVGKKIEINFSPFDNGIYILRISDNKTIITRKILKE